VDHTLPNDQPERETSAFPAVDEWVTPPPEQPAPLVHYDPASLDWEGLTACYQPVNDLLGARASSNPAEVTCPSCAATLVDGQVVRQRPAAAPLTDEQMDNAVAFLAVAIDAETRQFERRATERLDELVADETIIAPADELELPVATTLPDELLRTLVQRYGQGSGSGLERMSRYELLATVAEFGLIERAWDDDPAVFAETVPAEPERRTVGLEVLTDELRTAENARRREDAREANAYGVGADAADLIPDTAVVGIVLHLDGEPVSVPDVDTNWAARFRRPPDLLAALLRQARFYADDHDGAELLMPTPDVLAALAGQPDARLLTAPVHVLAMDVQAGMLLHATNDDGDGAETLELVSAQRDCTDPECIHGAVCVVLAVDGYEDPDVHFNGYARLAVRIPVAVTA
jgi:hypothetical protein